MQEPDLKKFYSSKAFEPGLMDLAVSLDPDAFAAIDTPMHCSMSFRRLTAIDRARDQLAAQKTSN